MSKKLNKKQMKSAKGGTTPEIYAPIVPTEEILKDAAEVAIYGDSRLHTQRPGGGGAIIRVRGTCSTKKSSK